MHMQPRVHADLQDKVNPLKLAGNLGFAGGR